MNYEDLLKAKCKAYQDSFHIANDWRNENINIIKKIEYLDKRFNELVNYLDTLKKEFEKDRTEAARNKKIVKRLTDRITELTEMQLKPEADAQRKLMLAELENVLVGDLKPEEEEKKKK